MAFPTTRLKLAVAIFFVFTFSEIKAKITENKTVIHSEGKIPSKNMNGGAALLFVDELKQTLERYLFGICPQNYKMPLGGKGKNTTAPTTCDVDAEQQDLAGRLAALSLRAHSAARAECGRLGVALANTLGELASTAAGRHTYAVNEANKKRKLSKSQKAKIQAKQRTALAVKKKAAAAAAAAAAKMA